MKAAALRGALSDRARGGNVHVLESLAVEGDRRRPRWRSRRWPRVSTARNVLVVAAASDETGWKSLRNATTCT